ncbi:MAG TPA: Gfo/Idh/MocA family oxidoreductase [Candidatus Brocadiia bacterium]|nr:Gfo/Idh/MocA family oxidoreductase [Candidatus Brocadiia bacterium]
MKAGRLSFGIAGCGSAGRGHIGKLLQIPEVWIKAICEPNREQARSARSIITADTGQQVQQYAHFKEMLSQCDVDAIGIFTPHHLHAEQVTEALEKGCHVIVEKPLCITAEEARAILALARRKERLVACCHNMRMIATAMRARKIIREGGIGEVRHVSSLFSQQWVREAQASRRSWRFEPSISGGGHLLDSGSHVLDIVLWCLGLSPVSAFARADESRIGVDVNCSAVIRLEDGVSWTLDVLGECPHEFIVRFYGSKAVLRLEPSVLRRFPVTEDRVKIEEVTVEPGGTDPMTNFARALLGDEKPLCDAESCVDTVRLTQALYESMATGKAIDLKPFELEAESEESEE